MHMTATRNLQLLECEGLYAEVTSLCSYMVELKLPLFF